MVALKSYYLALLPDEAFAAAVLEYKRRTKRHVGSQLFLDDPPHLTLYLASFANVPALRAAAREAAHGMQAPAAAVCGWHVFRDDPLNGNHTLVCDIDPQLRRDLAICQERICAAVSSLRDPDGTMALFAPSWQNLPEAARANVTQWGFPFVGSIWHPHMTIASIRPSDWDAVWSDLKNDPPGGAVRFSELCLYALEQGRSVLLERFALECVP